MDKDFITLNQFQTGAERVKQHISEKLSDIKDYITTDTATTSANGLMSSADKVKLDAISDTYATKTDMRTYIHSVQTTSTTFQFLDGNGDLVFEMPKVEAKPTPTLSLSTDTAIILTNYSDTVIVSSNSNGAISATSADTDVATVAVSDSSIVVSGISSGTTSIAITIAATNDYASATATLPVTIENRPISSITLTASPDALRIEAGSSDTATYSSDVFDRPRFQTNATLSPNFSWASINTDTKTITFTPTTDGDFEITLTLTATYRQATFTNTVTIKVTALAAQSDEPEPGEPGEDEPPPEPV